MSFFSVPTVIPEAKTSSNGELTRPRKPVQTTPEQRRIMHQDKGVTAAATIESRPIVKDD
jgi:hypothetical protein